MSRKHYHPQRRPGWTWLLAGGLALGGALVSFSQAPDQAELRARATRLLKENNFKEAYDAFRKLCLNGQADPKLVPQDLQNGVNCLVRLARVNETDEFVESTVKAHKDNWRLLQGAAQIYQQHLQHDGFIIAGNFERGQHRGGGKHVTSIERDRVRALQLMQQALPLAQKDDNKAEVARFYLAFAELWLNNRGYYEAWRLQTLTKLAELPDYEEQYFYRQYNGASVDEAGKPIYYSVPKSFEAATNDGERWRWCLDQAIENHPPIKNQVRMQFAQFLEQLFGVQSLQQGGYHLLFGRGNTSDDDTKQDESGTWELHTLKDNETIAKLATGVKRFELPDEFNFLKIYREIGSTEEQPWAVQALDALASNYENRRQYDQAEAIWKENIKRFGPGQNNYKQDRLIQIVGNWGMFDGTRPQSAGAGAKLDFVFRNGKKVKFDARAIKVDLLLEDIKAYLKSDPANRIEWQKLDIGQIGWRIVNEGAEKYLGEAAAAWELELDPRERHFDRRITVTTPLQKAGAYLVTSRMVDGNENKIVVWVMDTAIVRHDLDGKKLFFVADAASGAPLAGVNLEFFGWQQRHLGGNRFQVVTSNFATITGADGTSIPDPRDLKADNYQWLTVARGKANRLAAIGFQPVWYGQRHDPEYNQIKIFGITDRPVYRPDQKVEYKFWIRRAQYDQETVSEFAKKSYILELHNPKGEKVLDKTVETDEFGGITGEHALPKEATLGVYSFIIKDGDQTYPIGGNTFRVEEYKKPEFEVSIDAPSEPVMLGEKITAKIKAKYYFGSPVTKAQVKYKVLRSNHTEDWVPIARWDWCYGPGYWWFGYDYPWYRGWSEWAGCLRPRPSWIWRGQQQPPEVVAEVEKEIGADGMLEVEIDTSLAKAVHANTDHQYTITAEVRDESRRTIVGTGKVLVARKPFKVFSWIDRGYYRTGDTIDANFRAQTLDKKPVQGTGVLKLLKVTYDKKNQPVETPVEEWKLDTTDEGLAEQQLKAAAPGQYRLSYTVTDKQKHTIEGGYLFTVTGKGFDGAAYRFNDVELIPDKKEYAPGDMVKLQINTNRLDGTVLLFVRPTNGVYLPPKVIRLKGKSTIEEIGVVKKDMPNFFVEAVTVANSRVHTETKEIVVPPEKRVLNIEVLPSADIFKPGQRAQVKVKLTDHTGEGYEGTTVMTVYDKSVEYIAGGSNVPDIKEFFWKWRRHHQPQNANSLSLWSQAMPPKNKPQMAYLGIFGASLASELDAGENEEVGALGDASGLRNRTYFGAFGGGSGGFARRGLAMSSAMPMAAAKAEGAAAPADRMALFADAELRKSGAEQQQAPQPADVEPTVRTNFADTAKWVASLKTGKDGIAQVDFDMPENLTTWKFKVWGMGHGTRVGSGEAEAVTRKNLILRLQAPRFLVQKDEVVLSANVHNYLDKEKTVTVKLELEGDQLKPPAETTVKVKVPAGGEERVDWRVKVVEEGTATIRMQALTDEESDATQVKVPCYVHGMLKTDSYAGTIRPDKNVGKVIVNVPQERRPEQSLLEVRYSPSLALAMVDALPYLAEYPYGCTEQTLNRFLPSVITQKVLTEMKLDLRAIGEKRTNLNAQEIGDDRDRAKQWQRFERNPVFDPEELDRMVKEGVKALTDMQISDGGWGWFSGTGERSWPHTTAVVVHGLQLAKANDVPLVPGVLERGIEWLKRYQAEQVQWIKNWEQKDTDLRKKRYADNLDAMVYMILVDAGSDHAEMKDFLYRDRGELAVYAKGMFGLALDKVGDQEKRDMLVRNIEQFLVQDEENESAYLKLPENNWWWYWYGSEVEANAYYLKLLSKVDPKGEKAPRLVKYLLNNRKHATYWTSTRDTAVAVESFADYIRASGEQAPEMTVEVWLDGELQKAVEITSQNLFTFDNKFLLSGKEVKEGKHEVELRRKGKGPVYFNAYLTNFTLEDDIKKAGLEIKVERKYYQLTPVDKKINVEGQRGQPVSQKVEKYERKLLENLDTVKSGDLVEIELEIESKNDYEYILFEDMKAAGFEPVEVRSGYVANGLGAYMELRDDRVALFVRALTRGKHSLAYRMRAEIPGQFSALPTRAIAMYAPELRGNSDEIKLKITD